MKITMRNVGMIVIMLTLVVGIAGAQEEAGFKPPRIPKTECPCYSQADIEDIPIPYDKCSLDVEYENPDYVMSNIIYGSPQPIGGAEAVMYEDGSGYCFYIDWEDPSYGILYENLHQKQAETCYRFIVNVIEENIVYCETLVTGETDEQLLLDAELETGLTASLSP